MGCLRAPLEAFLGRSWELLGCLWALLGDLGRSGSILGALLGRFWVILGHSWALGRFEGRLGTLLSALGALLGRPGGNRGGAVGCPWDHIEHFDVGVAIS